jgi:hypothetical protein
VLFAPELNLTLLAGDAQDRYYRVPGRTLDDEAKKLRSRGVLEGQTTIEMVNEWDRFMIRVSAPGAQKLLRHPLETASQSEGGFERTYQGSVILPVWPLVLGDGHTAEFRVRIEFEGW